MAVAFSVNDLRNQSIPISQLLLLSGFGANFGHETPSESQHPITLDNLISSLWCNPGK